MSSHFSELLAYLNVLCGVSMYIHNILQYKLRKDLQLGCDVNSVFIEILKSSIMTKHNIICGCVYRPPFMSLKT